jgi:hypothetical protein
MTMCFFVYAGRTFTAEVSGSKTKHVQCVGCKTSYTYTVSGRAKGKGHAPYYIGEESAKQRAFSNARVNLERRLASRIEPVHCGRCGSYQPDMIQELRRRRYADDNAATDYNAFARLRVEMSRDKLYRVTTREPSIEGYEKFISVWPLDKDTPKLNRLLRKMKWRAGPGPRIVKVGAGLLLATCVALAVFLFVAVDTTAMFERTRKAFQAPPPKMTSEEVREETRRIHHPREEIYIQERRGR